MSRFWQYLRSFVLIAFITDFTLPLIWDGATPSQLPIDVETE